MSYRSHAATIRRTSSARAGAEPRTARGRRAGAGLRAPALPRPGAYGEVWVAVDRNTGRQVAIKFYAHRGGLDWSLLSREVEKLAFLSADRYVVQLLDVGWDAEPPYYVMEYVEHGSLEDLLNAKGPLPVDEAVALFREIAVGLLHAHGKGVLHCDLKPANVLLDQDTKPRLADFGQSRLSHEQTPALGTLFYMAPEQADLKAVPDVRWDVYALGALLYCMLTRCAAVSQRVGTHRNRNGRRPRRTAGRYRELIAKSPPPERPSQAAGRRSRAGRNRRQLPGRRPRRALCQRAGSARCARCPRRRRARRPLVVLGAVAPAIVLLVMSLFAWQSFETVVSQSDEAHVRAGRWRATALPRSTWPRR